MTIKVSVVIPVYNPGVYIEDCVASVLRQSLPADAYEAIFVDDGSTDGTAARLDELAADHPLIRVIHQENSGWSGKPRNVGIDASRGEYVMFVDNDDWLGDEALERMYAYGVAHRADVVVGKMAGRGRAVPRELFRVNRPHATVGNAPLIDSLTPHKMFRRAFLDERELRFPEGRRRLEDHVFVTEAYLTASRVAVLSDYVCYHHVRREDAANAGLRQIEPVGYFSDLREALDVVEKYTEPGPLRDKLYRRWFRNEMIERMRGERLLSKPEEHRRAMFHEMHRVAAERFGPGVLEGLAPTQQIVGELIAADRYPDVEDFARWERGIGAYTELTDLAWDGGLLRVGFSAGIRAGAEPVRFLDKDGTEQILVPAGKAGRGPLDGLAVKPPARTGSAKVDLVLRERSSSAEFYQPVEFIRERLAGPEQGEFGLELRATAHISPETAAGGAPLARGIWDVVVRVHLSGWTKDTRLGSARTEAATLGCRAAFVGEPPRTVVPYWTRPHDNLSLDVGHTTGRLAHDLANLAEQDVRVLAEPLLIEALLPVHDGTAEGVPAVLHLTEEARTGRTLRAGATLIKDNSGTMMSAKRPREQLAGGTWQLALSLPDDEGGRRTRLPLVLVASRTTGSLSLRRSRDGLTQRSAGLAVKFRTGFLRRVARRVRRRTRR
ncbi:glycosyltransferase family 2 protein [Streptomyces sp. NBC_00344]|uniref:glycosyltransferase family 2 protein n=1 Tax=Streptomyces sp. NBC_00344 TaxID=2975720 RepID=UPI002E212633